MGRHAPTGNSSADCPCRRALLRKSIFTAAQDGDLDHVTSFFECRKAHLHVDFADDFGYTSLHYACQWNRIDVVQYLLTHGANPNCAECGATPLHRASFRGAYESVCLLVQHSANLNMIDTSFGDRRTALHKAASQNHREIVALLVKAGADTSLCDAAGLTYDQVPVESPPTEPESPPSSLASISITDTTSPMMDENAAFVVRRLRRHPRRMSSLWVPPPHTRFVCRDRGLQPFRRRPPTAAFARRPRSL
ncbi:Aste57867_25152 [Aphanomyces stellatus]|uniref:Aste57867_25152 protein n=1 Tax=Aphanomyces stellatus TaxID=120398 RepID=A0A485LSF6_9STRA|nr:hypothetical protein As57867_025074 [Aphanomyces stellatus]VFU01781.1 Aste57867_25152 [Aphanomyces stellatus]